MFTYPGFKCNVDIVNQCPHLLSPLKSIWSISLAMGMKDMSPCPKTVAWSPLIFGNWELNMVWHASIVLSSNISPPSIWTFEFKSKLTVSNLIHELFVIVSVSNSLSLSIVMNPLWLQSVITSLVLWIFSLVSLSSYFLLILFKKVEVCFWKIPKMVYLF